MEEAKNLQGNEKQKQKLVHVILVKN